MEDYEKKDRQLENLVENYTRTQRHLEQYSEIGNPENKEKARKVQKVREAEIKTLENQIKGENTRISPEEHLENVKEKYNNTQGYIQNNKESMNEEMLRNLYEKNNTEKSKLDIWKILSRNSEISSRYFA